MVPFLDYAFNLVGTSERAVGYHLLSMIISYGIKDGRVGALFDRLSSLIMSVASREEADALLHLVATVLDVGTDDMMTYVNKSMTKIVNSACRVAARKDEFSAHALALLQLVAQSRSRSQLHSSTSAIKQNCAELIEEPAFGAPAATLLASLAAMESPISWAATWVALSAECADLLQNKLGIYISADKSISSPPSSSSSSSSSSSAAAAAAGRLPLAVSGFRKALAVESAFRGKCLVMAQMLSIGCSGGPTQLNLSSFVPLLQAVLSLTFSLSSQDPKCTIANDHGVSPADICLISSQLKLHTLAVLSQLLRARHPGLLRLASSLSRPVLAMLAGPELRAALSSSLLPQLLLATLEAARLAIRCFPTVVTSGSATGIQALADVFAAEAAVLCTYRGALGQVCGTEEEGGTGDAHIARSPKEVAASSQGMLDKWAALLETVEALLLFAGPLLPQQVRQSIEGSIGQLLACMAKGLLGKHGSEKKTRRSPCEAIRQAPGLQALVLRAAQCDVLSAQRSGIVSGNAALLKEALEACMHQPETCAQAMQGLMALDAMLRPTSVALPSVPPVTSALEFLRAQQNQPKAMASAIAAQYAETAHLSSSSSLPYAQAHQSALAQDADKRKTPIDDAAGAAGAGASSPKRHRTEPDKPDAAPGSGPPAHQRVAPAPVLGAPVPSFPSRAPIAMAAADKDDDDDDEDLPDIVDSKPDR